MEVLTGIAFVVFYISSAFFFGGFIGRRDAAARKKCTEKGTATLVYVRRATENDPDELYTIEFAVDGVRQTVTVPDGDAKGINTHTPIGTEVPIWYDPKNPRWVIIAEDPNMFETVASWKRFQKTALKWMLIFLLLTILFFYLSVK